MMLSLSTQEVSSQFPNQKLCTKERTSENVLHVCYVSHVTNSEERHVVSMFILLVIYYLFMFNGWGTSLEMVGFDCWCHCCPFKGLMIFIERWVMRKVCTGPLLPSSSISATTFSFLSISRFFNKPIIICFFSFTLF